MNIPKFETKAAAEQDCKQFFSNQTWERQRLLPLVTDQQELPFFESEYVDSMPRYRIIEIAGKRCSAKSVRPGHLELTDCFSSRLEWIIRAGGDFLNPDRCEVEFHYEGYVESGYDDPDSGVIATGNWNNKTRWNKDTSEFDLIDGTPERVSKLLEKLGVELEWSDEWMTCHGCYKLVRTEPDGGGWHPSYVLVADCEVVCHECLEADPDDYLDDQRGTAEGAEVSFDLRDHGYLDAWESGDYLNEKERKQIGKQLEEIGIDDYLWNNHRELWLPKEYVGRRKQAAAICEERTMDLKDYLSDLTEALTCSE